MADKIKAFASWEDADRNASGKDIAEPGKLDAPPTQKEQETTHQKLISHMREISRNASPSTQNWIHEFNVRHKIS